MSFIINVYENETLKYWAKKLEKNSFKRRFLFLKNLEIETFQNHIESRKLPPKEEAAFFPLSKLENSVKADSSIAVVIPVFIRNNEGKRQIERTLSLINRQTHKVNQIIIVDDCSPQEFNHYGATYHRQTTNCGPAAARNVGIEMALANGAKVIVFTDSDVVPSLNWIECILNSFLKNKNSHVISGHTNAYGKDMFSKYQEINGTLNGRRFIFSDMLLYGPSCNLAIEAPVFSKVRFDQGFPRAAGEDIFFCFEILKNGFNIAYEKEALVFHDFGFQRFRYFYNKKKFIGIFEKYAFGENILLQKIPNYYSYLSNTNEISGLSL